MVRIICHSSSLFRVILIPENHETVPPLGVQSTSIIGKPKLTLDRDIFFDQVLAFLAKIHHGIGTTWTAITSIPDTIDAKPFVCVDMILVCVDWRAMRVQPRLRGGEIFSPIVPVACAEEVSIGNSCGSRGL